MPVVTSDGATLRAFAEAVMRAAEHNVEEVVPVVLAVVGGILSEGDAGSVALQDGGDARDAPVVWASFGGRRTAFRYNPMTAMIELRAETLDGHPKRLFGRRSLHSDIVNFFGTDRTARLAREGRAPD